MENIPTWKWKGSNKFNGAFHRLRVPKIEGSIWYTMAINWHPHWNKVVWSPNKIPPKATKRSCFKGPKEDLNKCRASFPLLTTDHLHFHRLLEKYLEIEPKDLRCQVPRCEIFVEVMGGFATLQPAPSSRSTKMDFFRIRSWIMMSTSLLAASNVWLKKIAVMTRMISATSRKAVELAWKPCVCVSMSSTNLAEYAGCKRTKAISICYCSLARNVFVNVNTMPKS